MSTPPTAFTVTVNDVAPDVHDDAAASDGGPRRDLSLPTIGFSDPTFAEATIPYTPSYVHDQLG